MDNVSLVTAETDHLTSFAVLLMGDDGLEPDCSRLYWILSVTLLGVSCLFFLSVAILYSFWPRFRAFIYGYRDGRSIDNLMRKIDSKPLTTKISNVHAI